MLVCAIACYAAYSKNPNLSGIYSLLRSKFTKDLRVSSFGLGLTFLTFVFLPAGSHNFNV